jgi:hypothetical protein
VSCRDLFSRASPPSPERVLISPDTAALVVGDSLRLTAIVLDARGDTLPNTDVEWTSDWDMVAVERGVVRASLGEGYPTIFARAGDRTGRAKVWTQIPVVWAKIGLKARRLSPGARFTVRTTVQPGNQIERLILSGPAERKIGTIESSDPRVADWDGFNTDMTNLGRYVTAYAAGVTDLVFTYGGASDTLRVNVVVPKLLSADSAWNGGSWMVCGLDAGGEAWCRGSNYDGELGTLTAPRFQPPGQSWQQGSGALVGPDTDERFAKLAVSSSTWCGLALTKRVYCWGRGDGAPLGGSATTTNCYVNTYPGINEHHSCSFIPLPVDRESGQVLHFDDVASGRGVMCGHVIARGPTVATVAPADEYWCWGGSYGVTPQQRPGMFQ